MKKYIYSILVLVLFAFVGCVNTEELDSDPVRNGDVRLSIRTTSGLVARATIEDTSLEERIDWVDVFVFNADAEKTIFHKERIDVSAAPVYKEGEFPLLKKREEFGENTPYYVYLVANAKADLSSVEAGVECWADLQELVQEDTDLHFSAFVDAESKKPAFAGAPARFLMDGFAFLGNPNNPDAKGPEQMGTCVINDPNADDILLCGTLYRAAAKFIINIKPGSNVEFMKELLDADRIAQTPQYYINQLPVSTRVLPQQATDYYNATTQNTATTGLNPYTFVWNDNNSMTIVGYGYSDDWSKLEYTKQTSMVFNLPMLWDEDKDAATGKDGKEASTADNWYTIPLSKEKRFERNTCYVINVTVNAVGAEEREYAIELKDIEYKALPWQEVSMDLGGYGAAFLTLNTDLVKIYDTNIDKDQLTFTSSSPIVSIVLKDTFSHNEQNGSFEQGGAVIGADGLPTGEYTGTDGVYAYYIDKFGQKIQLGTDPGFDLKVVEQPEWTKDDILAKELNLYKKEGVADNEQYIRAEVWDEHKRALNGNITIHSPILPIADNEDLNWPSHFNTVRYLEFEVTNQQGIKAIFRVEQIPLVVVRNEEGVFSYRDDHRWTDDAPPAQYNKYNPQSLFTSMWYFYHEHDWTAVPDYTNVPEDQQDFSMVSKCPTDGRNAFCSEVRSDLNWIRAIDDPTEVFTRRIYKGLEDGRSNAIGPPYEKVVEINGEPQTRIMRKHYVWNMQVFFWSRFVYKVYDKDVTKSDFFGNGYARKKGQADIVVYAHPTNSDAKRFAASSYSSSFSRSHVNHRMYNVNITSVSADFTLAYPQENADGTTLNDARNARLVSPNIMVASQLGATNFDIINTVFNVDYPNGIDGPRRYYYEVPSAGHIFRQAVRHCQNYVEVTFEDKNQNGVWDEEENEDLIYYDDWRLPTRAEIAEIVKLQESSRAMDRLFTGEKYFAIIGAGSEDEIDSNWTYVNNISNPTKGYYVRCVRDVNRKK